MYTLLQVILFFFIEVEGCLLLNTGIHTSLSYDRARNIQL